MNNLLSKTNQLATLVKSKRHVFVSADVDVTLFLKAIQVLNKQLVPTQSTQKILKQISNISPTQQYQRLVLDEQSFGQTCVRFQGLALVAVATNQKCRSGDQSEIPFHSLFYSISISFPLYSLLPLHSITCHLSCVPISIP